MGCYCPSEPYHTITNQTLRDLLLDMWSAPCENQEPDDLWRHEWVKHGSCSGMDQETYFERGIKLFEENRDVVCLDGHLCFTPDGIKAACGSAPIPDSCVSEDS